MLQIPLDQLDEEHLRALEREGVPEGIRLEFKRDLDLSARKEKAEVSKDVSGMANAAGGRIVYGLEEKSLPDGSTMAGPIAPLTDGLLQEGIENIIADTIHPMPRYRIRRIDVQDGFVLILETYPSLGADLHMATGYDDFRFYRRGETRVNRMTEPEIREAYARVAVSTALLDRAIEENLRQELQTRRHAQESVLIAPWYSRRNLADPRLLVGIGEELGGGAFANDPWLGPVSESVRPFSGGMRGLHPDLPTDPERSPGYLAITRDGVIHASWIPIEFTETGEGQQIFSAIRTGRRLVMCLRAATTILARLNYWGPVRLVHQLWLRKRVHLEPAGAPSAHGLEKDTYKSEVPQVVLAECSHDFEPTCREILDWIYHGAGATHCPMFDGSGHLLPRWKDKLGL